MKRNGVNAQLLHVMNAELVVSTNARIHPHFWLFVSLRLYIIGAINLLPISLCTPLAIHRAFVRLLTLDTTDV